MPKAAQAQSKNIDLYKSATCGCCTAWGDAMEKAGYQVTTHVLEYDELDQFNKQNNVPDALASCHTATLDGKILVGHMPISAVEATASLPNDIVGLSVPGMPIGSVGMEQGTEKTPYQVIAFTKDGKQSIFQSH
jgi:hypothetical protein